MVNIKTWVEIPAINFDRAVAFYSHILNIQLEGMDFGQEKMACLPDDAGAISQAPDFKPSADGVLLSFYISGDLDEGLKRVEAAGGRVLIPKTKIEAEGRGHFAVFADSEGNRLGFFGD